MRALLLIPLLSSCSLIQQMTKDSDAKRLDRLCERSPELCEVDSTTSDTILTIKEIPVFDTAVVTGPTDTITLVNDRVTTTIIREHDTLFVNQIQEPDTITEIKTETITKYKATHIPVWRIILISLLSILTGMGALQLIKSLRK